MKKILLAATAAAAVFTAASPASAVTYTFTPGGASPSAGFTVVANFNNNTYSGFTTPNTALVQVLPGTSSSGNGAPPNFANGDTPYLSVLGGGEANYTFATPVTAFQFDWGSIDTYNTLTIRVQGGAAITYTGTQAAALAAAAASGNQSAPANNGLFTVLGTSGEQFTGITLTSGSNSFEVDNLAIGAVPEPTTWAMLLLGFGMVGVGLRTRRRARVTFA